MPVWGGDYQRVPFIFRLCILKYESKRGQEVKDVMTKYPRMGMMMLKRKILVLLMILFVVFRVKIVQIHKICQVNIFLVAKDMMGKMMGERSHLKNEMNACTTLCTCCDDY